MGMNTIDAKLLKQAFLAGAKNLEAKKEWINELNGISGSRWRYGYQYDHDHYGCCQRSCSD